MKHCYGYSPSDAGFRSFPLSLDFVTNSNARHRNGRTLKFSLRNGADDRAESKNSNLHKNESMLQSPRGAVYDLKRQWNWLAIQLSHVCLAKRNVPTSTLAKPMRQPRKPSRIELSVALSSNLPCKRLPTGIASMPY